MEQAPGNKVLIIYSSRSSGKTGVRGMATKEFYGNRKQGDRFEVYEADMRMRPDLFRPVAPAQAQKIVTKRGALVNPNQAAVLAERNRLAIAARKEVNAAAVATETLGAPPPPPPPAAIDPDYEPEDKPDYLSARLNTLDWKGTKVNKNHLKILMSNGITSLNKLEDTDESGESDLVKITGIGDVVVDELYKMRAKYLN